MKKMFCLMLALVMTLSMIPLTASAEGPGFGSATVTVTVYYAKDFTTTFDVTVGSENVTLGPGDYVKSGNQYYEFQKYSNGGSYITIPAYDGTTKWHNNWDKIAMYYVRHSHNYKHQYNRMNHWQVCACGHTTAKHPHQDPATLKEKICSCGYKFSDNCDLSVLWLQNMNLSERYDMKKTDYTAILNTWADVTETAIRYQTYDAKATVQLPEDLTVNAEGFTTFEIVVTAEDKSTTQTYTVTAVRPVTVEGCTVLSDGMTVSTKVPSTTARRVATAEVSETLLTELAAIAKKDNCAAIVLEPDFNFWHNETLNVLIPSASLKDTKADLTLTTLFGTVTIPNAELTKLMENTGVLTITTLKADGFQIAQDGKEVTNLSKNITWEQA